MENLTRVNHSIIVKNNTGTLSFAYIQKIFNVKKLRNIYSKVQKIMSQIDNQNKNNVKKNISMEYKFNLASRQ